MATKPKPSLIIVHGMGDHTRDSFKAEIVESLNYALSLYKDWKKKKIEDLVEIEPFEYNSTFEQHRDRMAQSSVPLQERLAALTAANLHPIPNGFAAWDGELNQDDFFRTHWLDVLFYRFTYLAEMVRLDLARLITETIDEKGAENVHILAHSLGTSVLHDTLASLYKAEPAYPKPRTLDPDAEKLRSVHMVANVSSLLQSFAKAGQSVVNPCDNGCTFTYFQYRHVLDPITWPSPFDPVANDYWQDPFSLGETVYQRLRPSLITDFNTHAITHYLQNPQCHAPMMKALGFKFWPSDEEIKDAFTAHGKKALEGQAQALQDRWKELKPKLSGLDDVAGFIRAAQALREMLAGFGKGFN